MDKLTNYIFHYNQYTDRWAAIPRGKERDYWNKGQERHKGEGIIYSNDINVLMKFVKGEF